MSFKIEIIEENVGAAFNAVKQFAALCGMAAGEETPTEPAKKRGPGRPKKAEPDPQAAKEAESAGDDDAGKAEVAETATELQADPLTADQVRDAILGYVTAYAEAKGKPRDTYTKREAFLNVLNAFEVAKVSEIPEAKYPAVMVKVAELTEAI